MIIFGAPLLQGQERQSLMEQMLEKSQKGQDISSLQPLLPPLTAPVNPETYVVGPGDVFEVNIWLSTPLSFTLPVSPEGTLIVPTVGEVKVADRTLAEAKRSLVDAMKKKYISQTPTATLVKPRTVVVFVYGHVAAPGRYVVFASDRVEKVIRLANSEFDSDPSRMTMRPVYRETTSERHIMLRRRGGNVIRVDLTKFHATGDDRWNPGLVEGDEIIVSRLDGSYNTIGVYGGVNLPGRFEFVEGETVRDAITLARGFSSRAVQDTLFLLRLGESKAEFVRTAIPIPSGGDWQEAGIPLTPGDRILVKQERELRGDNHVVLEGEVRKPGMYPIVRDRTRLVEVVAAAEGFTNNVLLSAAELRRAPQGEQMKDRFIELLKSAGGISAVEDTVYFRVENQLRAEWEFVSVDFEGLFVRGDSSQNVLLRDGDRIVIPSSRKSVYVFGQVVQPGHVAYVAGSSVSYYVSKTGGFAQEAKPGDVRIVKAGTKQWLDPAETTIEEGDAVWVPKEIRKTFSYYLNIIGQTASIISATVTTILLIIQLQK